MSEDQTAEQLTAENKEQENVDSPNQQQEDSVYQQQLNEFKAREEASKAEAEAELAKKDEIIEKKNRALEAEKKKTGTAAEELKKELLVEVEKKFVSQELDRRLKSFTSDPVEQQVIKKHYENSIRQSGNLDNDFRLAVAVANSNVVWEQKEAKAREENNENYLTTFQSASAVKGQEDSRYKSSVQSQAEALVRSLNPNAVKHVAKYFKK